MVEIFSIIAIFPSSLVFIFHGSVQSAPEGQSLAKRFNPQRKSTGTLTLIVAFSFTLKPPSYAGCFLQALSQKPRPLFVAAQNGHVQVVNLLLKFKAGLNLCSTVRRSESCFIRLPDLL